MDLDKMKNPHLTTTEAAAFLKVSYQELATLSCNKIKLYFINGCEFWFEEHLKKAVELLKLPTQVTEVDLDGCRGFMDVREATCLFCACTDSVSSLSFVSRSWVLVNRTKGIGLCSYCLDRLLALDAKENRV